MPRRSTTSTATTTDGEKLGTYVIVSRMYRIHAMMFEQQEKDNGVKPWIDIDHIVREVNDGKIGAIRAAIHAMQNDFGLPLDYVEKRKGWGYTEKVTQFPLLVYTRGDSMGLCAAMLGTSMYAGTPFAKEAR